MPKLDHGLIQIYTGPGKGKTTAAIGLALRASSHGFKIAFLQFLKSGHDATAITAITRITYHHFGLPHEQFGWLLRQKPVTPSLPPSPSQSQHLTTIRNLVQTGWQVAQQLIIAGRHDIIILDELNLAIYFGLLPTNEIIRTINNRPSHVEIVITGREAPRPLLAIADLVTRMQEIKHPYQKGVLAREGIEY